MGRPRIKMPTHQRNYRLTPPQVTELIHSELGEKLTLAMLRHYRVNSFGPSYYKPNFRCVLYDARECLEFARKYFGCGDRLARKAYLVSTYSPNKKA